MRSLLAVTAAIALTALPGCHEKQATPRARPVDPLFAELARTHPQVASSYLDLLSTQAEDCPLARVYSSVQAAPTKHGPPEANALASRVLGEMGAEESALCRSAKAALAALRPPLEKLGGSARLPAGLFAFSFFESDSDSNGDEVFRAVEVLPFLDLASCQGVEAVARDAGLPTRACAPWQPLAAQPQ